MMYLYNFSIEECARIKNNKALHLRHCRWGLMEKKELLDKPPTGPQFQRSFICTIIQV